MLEHLALAAIAAHHGSRLHETGRSALLSAVAAFTVVHAREHLEHPEIVREEAEAVRIVHPRTVRMLRQVLGWLGSVLLPVRRPGVSVVTPTWQRHELLVKRCIPSVQAQVYSGDVEHVVVSDGPDGELAGLVPGAAFLPQHVDAGNRGVAARRRALEIATQPVVAYLDDDNSWRPRHLDLVAGALLESGADFAYAVAICHAGDYLTWAVGRTPPAYAQIDTSLIVHRRELLALGNWQESRGPADWDLVRRWLQAGATWAFVPQVTLDYYFR